MDEMDKNKSAVIYARVSLGNEKGATAKLVEELAKCAKSQDYKIQQVYQESEGVLNCDYPVLKKCINFCKSCHTDVLLIYVAEAGVRYIEGRSKSLGSKMSPKKMVGKYPGVVKRLRKDIDSLAHIAQLERVSLSTVKKVKLALKEIEYSLY